MNGFGGMCTCPDGQSYEVGAIGDCASLACEGGFPGACEREEKVERQGMKVTCARGMPRGQVGARPLWLGVHRVAGPFSDPANPLSAQRIAPDSRSSPLKLYALFRVLR